MGKSWLDGAVLQVGDCSTEQTADRRQAIVSLVSPGVVTPVLMIPL